MQSEHILRRRNKVQIRNLLTMIFSGAARFFFFIYNCDDELPTSIISTALLAIGCDLQRNSYTQATLDTRNARRTLAHILWNQRTHPQAESLRQPGPTNTQVRQRAKRQRPGMGKGIAEQKPRCKGAIVRGSTELQHPGHSRRPTKNSQGDMVNRKRSAKSVASPNLSLTKNSQRCLPLKTKRQRPGPRRSLSRPLSY